MGALYTKNMRVSVIIPTYNEAASIECVLSEIQAAISHADEHDWSVIVVDANSPDKTARLVRKIQSTRNDIHLIVEPEKRGIGRAYLAGIQYAKDTLKSDAFVEFDGDGQHDPTILPSLVKTLADGADCVIGSRYIPGGSIPREWKLYRKVLSRGGSTFARMVLRLPVRDVTSGLKATSLRSAAAGQLPLSEERLLSPRYAYKIQFVHAITKGGGTFAEIPMTFRTRGFDYSKSSWNDIVDSLKVIVMLRLQSLPKRGVV